MTSALILLHFIFLLEIFFLFHPIINACYIRRFLAAWCQVLFFSTMTRLLDVMEDYLSWKRYRYLRLDGHTSGLDRGALVDEFNRSDSQAFIFLLRFSIFSHQKENQVFSIFSIFFVICCLILLCH